MDSDTIYCDESSVASLSQPQGRPALRLDSLPPTPMVLTPCDSNVTASARKNQLKQQRHQHRPSFACTALTSPSLSQSDFIPETQSLTPPPRPGAVGSASGGCDNEVEGGMDVSEANDNACADSSALSSGRPAVFSISRELNSTQSTEDRSSSPSSLLREPRATITPRNFPHLQLSDCEVSQDDNDEHVPDSQGSALEQEFQACLEGHGECFNAEGESAEVFGRQPLITSQEVYEEGCGSNAMRRSMLLPAGAALGAMSGGLTPPGEPTIHEEQLRPGCGKRVRSLQSSLLLCNGGISPLVGGASEVGTQVTNAPDEEDERKRFRPDSEAAQRRNEALMRTAATDVQQTQLSNSCLSGSWDVRLSPATEPRGRESLLLVSGSTPTPSLQVLTGTPVRDGAGCASEILDTRDSANANTSAPASTAPNNETSLVGSDYDSVWPRNVAAGDGTGEGECALRISDTTEECCDCKETLGNKAVGGFSGVGGNAERGPRSTDHRTVVPDGEGCAELVSSLRLSEEFRSFVEGARSEVRRASERLLAKLEEVSRTYSGSNVDGGAAADANGPSEAIQSASQDAVVAAEGRRVVRSLQLSLNRSSVVLGELELAQGRSTLSHSGSRGDSINSILSDTSSLRRQLATHAAAISRRLHGYDLDEAGTLPMIVVVRVVQQVLMIGSPSSVAPNSEEAADLSMCIASPSPVTKLQHQKSQSPMSVASPGTLHTISSGGVSSPSATHRSLWERMLNRRKASAMEDDAMKMYIGLWRCFHECFGERGVMERLGVQASGEADDGSDGTDSEARLMTPTCLPLLRQQLNRLGCQQGRHRYHPPPLDVMVNYRVFAHSLAELW